MTRSREQIRAMLDAQQRRRDERDAKWLERRVRYLPAALETARARLSRLEDEALRYGLHDLVQERA